MGVTANPRQDVGGVATHGRDDGQAGGLAGHLADVLDSAACLATVRSMKMVGRSILLAVLAREAQVTGQLLAIGE